MYGYRLLTSVNFEVKDVEQEVYDFEKLYTSSAGLGYPFAEIIVFLHNNGTGSWKGYREVKFATLTRSHEDVVKLYDIGDGGYNNSIVKLDRETKKLTVTSSINNMLCDVYAMFLPHSNLINKN